MLNPWQVVIVAPRSTLLAEVKALGKKYSRWLGHYPEGAYDESAEKGRILAVIDQNSSLLGYLLYRVSRSNVTIAHLCAASAERGKGISHVLFGELKARTKDCHGVKLRCRRDFPASSLWPKLGFVPLSDRPGRSASGALLTTWWYEYDQPTLFAVSHDDSKPHAVLDANILFDLQDKPNSSSRGIAALSAPWLSEEVEFCVTSEIFVEINRATVPSERARRWKFAQQYTAIVVDEIVETRVINDLRELFPIELSESDESDLKQLAKAIAGNASFFITWDTAQLGRADAVQQRYGLAILRPLDLVIELDAKLRESEYVPTRIAGSLSTVSRIGSAEVKRLQRAFQDFRRAEQRGAFIDALHAANTDLHRSETCVVSDPDGQDAALFCIDLRDPNVLRIPLLRLRGGRLVDGLAHQVVWRAVTRACASGRRVVEVNDRFLAPAAETALKACDFAESDESDSIWRKHVVRVCGTRAEVLRALNERNVATADNTLTAGVAILGASGSVDTKAIAHLERVFWPVKIIDTAVPNYIVPIRPAFAAQLFDEGLADQDLFGAKEHLAMSLRNVYYRSAKGMRVPAPSRILWYVSGQKGYAGSGAIRAVSLVEESVRGPAKELFRRFQRLGAYSWTQILRSAGGDHRALLEAFTFTHTELLRAPVAYDTAQSLLLRHLGTRNPIAGPVWVPELCFDDLYRLGTEMSSDS